jgi:retron-type reverse transcriptase
MVNDFYNENIMLDSINTAYITLIPKKSTPMNMNDYRPISLVSLPLKFITKLMANRLQKDIIPILHQNQYGFIKTRNIQDCIAWAFEYLHICHLSKKPIIILKIDFEKAFDKVEYNAILAMLHAKGFGPKWISLVKSILLSASTSVLLNGVPGKKILCKRGVRQGDPLSPLLFVNTSELLQSIINDAWNRGILSLPIDDDFGQKYPIL